MNEHKSRWGDSKHYHSIHNDELRIGEADACGEGIVGIDDDDDDGVRGNGVREGNGFQYEVDVAADPFSLNWEVGGWVGDDSRGSSGLRSVESL